MGSPVRTMGFVVASLVGVAAGLGAFTFDYAEGTSYLSSDPAACVNCHIMRPQYDGWQRGSHHAVATCVDCHLPAGGIGKWVAKASNGYHHSRAFTFQDFHEPIVITPGNAALLQANCERCHGELLHGAWGGEAAARDDLGCVHCHVSVGHGERAGLGGALRDDETRGIQR